MHNFERYNPSKIWCPVLAREMRYFKSDILPLRSFVLMYPFLWRQLNGSSKGLCTLLVNLVNLVLTYERAFWKTHSSCNRVVSSRLLSFCSIATHVGDIGKYSDQPRVVAVVKLQKKSKVSPGSKMSHCRGFIMWKEMLQICPFLTGFSC